MILKKVKEYSLIFILEEEYTKIGEATIFSAYLPCLSILSSDQGS